MKSTFRRGFAAFSLVALVSVIAAATIECSHADRRRVPQGGNVRWCQRRLRQHHQGGAARREQQRHDRPGERHADGDGDAVAAERSLRDTPRARHSSVTPGRRRPPVRWTRRHTPLLDLSTLGVPGCHRHSESGDAHVAGRHDRRAVRPHVDARQPRPRRAAQHRLRVGQSRRRRWSDGFDGESVSADAVTVLDLRALLNLVGLDLTNLSVEATSCSISSVDPRPQLAPAQKSAPLTARG